MEAQKIILITGANSGIGLATAEILAKQGHQLVTVCRRKDAGDQLVASLKALNPKIQVENFQLDLGDLHAVKRVGGQIREKYPRIDRLINNAGFYPVKVEWEGEIEKTLLASHLGHMLLTLELKPSLEASDESRIINVSSALHKSGSTQRFFKKVSGLSEMNAYADAKFANLLFSMELPQHLPAHVTAYSLHPGVVNTNFAAKLSGWMKAAFSLMKPFLLTPEKGAATSVFLATAPIAKISGHNGGYFDKSKYAGTGHPEANVEKAQWLWNTSMELLKPYLA